MLLLWRIMHARVFGNPNSAAAQAMSSAMALAAVLFGEAANPPAPSADAMPAAAEEVKADADASPATESIAKTVTLKIPIQVPAFPKAEPDLQVLDGCLQYVMQPPSAFPASRGGPGTAGGRGTMSFTQALPSGSTSGNSRTIGGNGTQGGPVVDNAIVLRAAWVEATVMAAVMRLDRCNQQPRARLVTMIQVRDWSSGGSVLERS